MSVADGVGHGLFCGLSQSPAQCSAVAARRPLCFGSSLRWDADNQISICAVILCGSSCVIRFLAARRAWLASCKTLASKLRDSSSVDPFTGRLSTASDPPPERWRRAARRRCPKKQGPRAPSCTTGYQHSTRTHRCALACCKQLNRATARATQRRGPAVTQPHRVRRSRVSPRERRKAAPLPPLTPRTSSSNTPPPRNDQRRPRDRTKDARS